MSRAEGVYHPIRLDWWSPQSIGQGDHILGVEVSDDPFERLQTKPRNQRGALPDLPANQLKGLWSEALAAAAYRREGLTLLRTRQAYSCGEIDLVLGHRAGRIFSEVRFRQNRDAIEAAFGSLKRLRCLRAAHQFAQASPAPWLGYEALGIIPWQGFSNRYLLLRYDWLSGETLPWRSDRAHSRGVGFLPVNP